MTRRERNTNFGKESPELVIDSTWEYLWDWYHDLRRSVLRARDGVALPVPPSEFIAWREATGNIVYPAEYGILRAMDVAFCDELGKELQDYQARKLDSAKQGGK